jgi:hypothetical protein
MAAFHQCEVEKNFFLCCVCACLCQLRILRVSSLSRQKKIAEGARGPAARFKVKLSFIVMPLSIIGVIHSQGPPDFSPSAE